MEEKNLNNHTNLKENVYYFKVLESSSHDIVVHECGREVCDKNKEVIDTIYYYYAFHVVIKGKGYYEILGKRYEIKENTIFCFFPGEKIKYYPNKDDPWEYSWINFSGLKAKDFITRSNFSPKNPIYEFTDKAIIEIVQKIIHTKDTYTRDLYTVSYLYELFAKIIDNRYGKSFNTEIISSNHVVNATNYITNNLNNPSISLKQVAKYLGISEVYLSRLFSKNLGIPFSKVVNNYRIQKACNYLENTDYSIKEISYLCGYMSPFYFDKKFNEIIKTTPSNYKKNTQNKKKESQ